MNSSPSGLRVRAGRRTTSVTPSTPHGRNPGSRLYASRSPLATPAQLAWACAALVAAGCGAPGPLDDVQAAVAPSGALRAAVNVANPVMAIERGPDGLPGGVAVALAQELGRRLGLPVHLQSYDSAAAMADDAPRNVWDVAFLAADPDREATIAFTAPYMELDATYLVPVDAPLQTLDEVDAAGVRIAARPRSAYDLFLRRNLRHATLVYPDTGETDLDVLADGRADVLAGLRHMLVDTAAGASRWRVLDGRFAAMGQAIGVPRERSTAAAYVRAFVEDAKASGLVAAAIAATAAEGVSVAPPARP